MIYDFRERLTFSLGERKASDHETIKSMLLGCVSVQDSSQLLNLAGVDYVATLRHGAEVLIDAKNRNKGCSEFWDRDTKEPQFSLEVWSIMPGGKYNIPDSRKKIGWTLSESKKVDLILFKFHPEDTRNVYLVCFQLLRMAFRKNFHKWKKLYRNQIQESKELDRKWQSQCIFVPASVVYEAMKDVSIGTLPNTGNNTQ